MPVPRVKIVVQPKSPLTFSSFQTTVNSKIQPSTVYKQPFRWSYDPSSNEYVLDTQFKDPKSASDFYAYFSLNLASVKGFVSGKASIHDCTHEDVVVVPCNDPSTGYAELIF